MSFCTECGIKLDAEARNGNFCPDCGAPLPKEEGSNQDNFSGIKSAPIIPGHFTPPAMPSFSSGPSKPKMPPMPGQKPAGDSSVDEDAAKRLEVFKPGFSSYGIIFTDTRKIAKQCRSTSNDIYNLIKNYTVKLANFDHQYIIYDIDSSRYRDQSWQTYVDELSSFYDKQQIQPEYLFIIGGTEIIPMPVFDSWAEVDVPDFDYDTDLPYSYLKSYDVEEMAWDGTLYYEDVKLHVGRLPFGEDFTKIQLTNYFDKVISALSQKFDIENCFGLSASGWQDASETVLDSLSIENKYITFSPEISLYSVDEVFDETSDILYFNLHGSDAPEQPHFFGDYDAAISTGQISRMEKNNIIITEACYGAKFIGYDTSNSMLLNSIHQKTLAYFGSSRIAFGSSTYFLFSADIIAQSILGSLSDNMTMGQALSKARVDNIESVEYEDDYSLIDLSLVTAIEFNLFGDPALRPFNGSIDFNTKHKVASAKKVPQKVISEEIFNKSKPQNILEAVRAAVDSEFDKISKIIQQELYQQYDLKPDELQKITHKKSTSSEQYLYMYSKKQKNALKNKLYFINCSSEGSIKKVITSK